MVLLTTTVAFPYLQINKKSFCSRLQPLTPTYASSSRTQHPDPDPDLLLCVCVRHPPLAVPPELHRHRPTAPPGGRMRRRPGIGGLQTAAAARDQYRLLGENVAKLRTDLMKEQLVTFRSHLEEFARQHKNDIRKNPTFRAQFHEMCAKVGVDPLASNKGFWAELLGIGDFYYELGVQIVEICLATRPHNGGLITLQELCNLLVQKRKYDREPVSEDDCLRAISKLKILGSGFEVISVGKKKLVRSVPTELNKDHNEILELAQVQGYVMVEEIERRLSWSAGRAIDALDTLLEEGLAMVDDGHKDGKRRYWFPCVSSISSTVGADAVKI